MESIKLHYTDEADLKAIVHRVHQYPSSQVLIQVFSGIVDFAILENLRTQLVRLFPRTAIIGVTTEGEILGGTTLDNSIIINFSLFTDTQVQSIAQPLTDDMPLDQAGLILRNQLQSCKAKVAFVYGTAMHQGKIRDDNAFIEQLTALPNDVIIAGGLAGIHNLLGKNTLSYVLTERGILANGNVAAVLMSEHLKCETYRNDGWIPVGRKMKITKANGNRVYTIEDKTIEEIYKLYLNREYNLEGHLQTAIDFPLVYFRDGMMKKNVPIARHADGSFSFFHHFQSNEWVQFGFCDLSSLFAQSKALLHQISEFKPEAIFLFSCSARKKIFGNQLVTHGKPLEDIASTIGFFSGSEYYTAQQRGYCMLQSMSTLAMSENTGNTSSRAIQPDPALFPDQIGQQTFKLLRTLTHLISVTSKELQQSQQKLLEMAQKDSITDLFNRSYFDQQLPIELNRSGRSKSPLALLLLDIDYFKQFNDHYGHVAGDECLEHIGQIIIRNLNRSTDIGFRYGGEELGCILPATELAGALKVANGIQNDLKQASIAHEGSPIGKQLTVSIGVIGYIPEVGGHPDAKALIRLSDALLYQAKAQGRNQIVSDIVTDLAS